MPNLKTPSQRSRHRKLSKSTFVQADILSWKLTESSLNAEDERQKVGLSPTETVNLMH